MAPDSIIVQTTAICRVWPAYFLLARAAPQILPAIKQVTIICVANVSPSPATNHWDITKKLPCVGDIWPSFPRPIQYVTDHKQDQ